jgi:hypothetical protein
MLFIRDWFRVEAIKETKAINDVIFLWTAENLNQNYGI